MRDEAAERRERLREVFERRDEDTQEADGKAKSAWDALFSGGREAMNRAQRRKAQQRIARMARRSIRAADRRRREEQAKQERLRREADEYHRLTDTKEGSDGRD